MSGSFRRFTMGHTSSTTTRVWWLLTAPDLSVRFDLVLATGVPGWQVWRVLIPIIGGHPPPGITPQTILHPQPPCPNH